MGKRQKFQGCSKQGLYKANRERRHTEAEARAMLLGGVYHRHSECITVTKHEQSGNWPNHWSVYYDHMGEQISERDYQDKVQAANIKKGREKIPVGKYTSSITSDLWSKKLEADFKRSQALSASIHRAANNLRQAEDQHLLDAMRYGMVVNELPPEVTKEEVDYGRSEVRNSSRDDVRDPRGSRVHIRGPRRQDNGRF